ncbi:MAG: hypothetical protein Q8916_03360 [Bacteroidota bacterium]|nr:hypothetical protein [Bacteroidota bacterium]MDP4235938.1 hypothetical protein [Bacteroidota bacterium]
MEVYSFIDDFFSHDVSGNLKEPDLVRQVLAGLAPDSAMFYEITFHGAFAKRMFDVMRREGPNTIGFERMQQSFTESVQKVRTILEQMEAENLVKSEGLTSATPEARAKLSRFIEDLSLLKNWLTSRENR